MTMKSTLLDPQLRKDAAEDQASFERLHSHRVAQTPAQSNYKFGQAREVHLLQSIESNDFTLQGENRANQLAEAYAYQGRFKEAANIARDVARRVQYQAYARAMESRGSRLCLCPSYRREKSATDAKGTKILNHQQIKQVFDGKQHWTFYRCGTCQTISSE